jgi:hypothetical protein
MFCFFDGNVLCGEMLMANITVQKIYDFFRLIFQCPGEIFILCEVQVFDKVSVVYYVWCNFFHMCKNREKIFMFS